MPVLSHLGGRPHLGGLTRYEADSFWPRLPRQPLRGALFNMQEGHPPTSPDAERRNLHVEGMKTSLVSDSKDFHPTRRRCPTARWQPRRESTPAAGTRSAGPELRSSISPTCWERSIGSSVGARRPLNDPRGAEAWRGPARSRPKDSRASPRRPPGRRSARRAVARLWAQQGTGRGGRLWPGPHTRGHSNRP